MSIDKIFVNGNVVTMNPDSPQSSAFGIMGGRFCAVGSDDELRNYADPTAIVVDLGGKTVVPGFIETHNHLSWFSIFVLWADCTSPRNETIDDVKSRIREKVEDLVLFSISEEYFRLRQALGIAITSA